MILKVALLAASVSGLLTLAAQKYTGPDVLPARVCPFDEILITDPTGYELGLAVITPEGRYLFLADHSSTTVVPYYWTEHSVRLRAKDLIGLDYDNGRPHLRPVFRQAGKYEFYFAKNLETEPENTLGFMRPVTFMGHNHPDCPKSPLD